MMIGEEVMIERRAGGSIAKNYKPHFLNVQVACQ
jgi:hypothetical protein